jgi:hypothetical protein
MSWTRQRVLILAAVIFAAHVIALSALHTPPPMVVLPEGFRTPRLVRATPSTNNVIELDGLNDPLVFAGAHQHGFSASAWMMRPQQEYAFTNAPVEPRYLAFSRPTTELPIAQVESKVQPQTSLPFVSFVLAKEPPHSILRIEGGLEGRQLLKAPILPIQLASDVLSNTAIQVGVRMDGFPFSARIVSGSGSRGADLAALDLANKARFAPLPAAESPDPAELQWGEMVFQWFTTEPSATNGLPKTSVSAAK